MKRKIAVLILTFSLVLLAPVAGCGRNPATGILNPVDVIPAASEEKAIDISPEMVPLSEFPAMFSMPMPAATGDNVVMNAVAEIDISNTKDGYVMARYLKITAKPVKIIIRGPGGTSYTYSLKADGEYEVYPLSGGNGVYQITVYENVYGKRYSTALQTARDVVMTDEFAPFIRPNQYVNYNADSKVVEKAAGLTKNLNSVTDKISAVYGYITKNISYDWQLAASVKAGYLPDVDNVLQSGKGICFDYAAVMTAMLRSQGIPTKLVIGYTGSIYHAWINVYSEDTGWVDGIVYFDGKSWKIMDPTFASAEGNNGGIMKYISNEKNYTAKYLY